MNGNNRKFIAAIILFITLTAVIIVFRTFLENAGFDLMFLYVSNGLLFLLSVISLMVQRNTVDSANPQKFVRGVTGSMMIKMFVCMVVLLIYLFTQKEKINKPALFTSMGMYVFYTVFEVAVLMKAARNKNA